MGQKTLLVVDDEWLIRAMMADYFGEAGFNVLEASSATQALLILAESPVDILLSDIKMPGEMDGMELARRLRSTRPDFPMVLMSGGSVQGDIEAAFGNAVPFFAKPIDLPELERCVRNALQGIAHRSSAYASSGIS
jgi:CheY-like chemotaxis protein